MLTRPDYGYSAGPFTRIQFLLCDGKLGIYVPKYKDGLDDKGCLVSTISSAPDNGRYIDVYKIR